MKKIFSRVAHAFKHDSAADQEAAADASPSPAAGDAGEHASLTSVDSGVLVDVPEPERSPGGAAAGAGAEPASPVTDRDRECAEPAAGIGADLAASSITEVTIEGTAQTAAGQAVVDEERPPAAAAGHSAERERETTAPRAVGEGKEPVCDAAQEQELVAAAQVQEPAATNASEWQKPAVPVEGKPVPGAGEELATPTQKQEPTSAAAQGPTESISPSRGLELVPGAVQEQLEQSPAPEITEDRQEPAAVERPAAGPSGDLQSGTGAAAAAADSAGRDHPDRPGTAADGPQPAPAGREQAEVDSVNRGQAPSDDHVKMDQTDTVEGATVNTVENTPVHIVGSAVVDIDEVESVVTVGTADNEAANSQNVMEAVCVGGATEESAGKKEPTAPAEPPVIDSDGVLLETGTEDTADDLDGKPKDKKKKRKKKKKYKPEESASVSLAAETVAKEAEEDKVKSASTKQTSEKPSDGVKKAVTEASGQTVRDDAADLKTNKTKTKVSSSLTAGTKASTAKTKKSAASLATKKLVDSAAQRNGTAKAKSALAKQSTSEASGSRSATPARPLQNPAKSRLKTQLRKETSVESNASASSAGSSSARSTRSGKRSAAANLTTPGDQSGARASPAARRDSLPLSVSSGSTTVSTRGEDTSAKKAKAKSAKQQAEKSALTARSSTPTARTKKSDAAPVTKAAPEKKTSMAGQSGTVKKEKKTKVTLAKDKKTSGTKKTAAATTKSEVKSTSPTRIPEATATDTKTSEQTATGDASVEEMACTTAQPISRLAAESQSITAESNVGDSADRTPLSKEDTVDHTSALRPPLVQHDTIQDSPQRPPLTQHDTIEVSSQRPPLTQHDTIEDSTERPPLTQHNTIEDSTERPPLTQHNTIEDSTERPPLTQHKTIENSTKRAPLTQHNTIEDSTKRPRLSEQDAVDDASVPRPPLIQHDTIDDTTTRPPLSEQETLEDTSVLRPPLVQHDAIQDDARERPLLVHDNTIQDGSPKRPPLTQLETIDRPVTEVASASEIPTPSDQTAVIHPSSPAISAAVTAAEAAVPQVTLSPSSAAAPTSPSSAAAPTLPSSAASDGGSRRSSMDVLDGPPRLRRSISGHGGQQQQQPGTPRPDAVLEAMSQVHADSEARLAARRQARAEAREIRMRELERQQREAEQNGEKLDDFSDVSPRPALSAVSSRAPRGPSAASTGRRGSEDSAEDSSTTSGGFHLRDVRHELRELEEKLRKTMVTSAQLDNDKSTLSYQVELLKDKLEEMQEAHTQLQREHRTRCSEHEQLKRVSNRLKEDYECCKKLLEERDKLIAENGLVLVGDEEDSESESTPDSQRPQKALVSQNAAQLLDKAGGGTLDSRLRRLGEEKNELEDQLRRLKLELEEERHMSARARISGSGPGAESDQVQREVARQVGEYRFKLQKADQDITNLQTAVQRLENQVARYKAAAETAEKSEEELKGEKRKLQRELRESLTRVDELETTNSHLQKRLDKLKNARSALLKDLSTE